LKELRLEISFDERESLKDWCKIAKNQVHGKSVNAYKLLTALGLKGPH
jgi:hypothetical protein